MIKKSNHVFCDDGDASLFQMANLYTYSELTIEYDDELTSKLNTNSRLYKLQFSEDTDNPESIIRRANEKLSVHGKIEVYRGQLMNSETSPNTIFVKLKS